MIGIGSEGKGKREGKRGRRVRREREREGRRSIDYNTTIWKKEVYHVVMIYVLIIYYNKWLCVYT